MARKREQKPEVIRAALLCGAETAVAVLLSLMQNEEYKPELRMKAAESILDRVLGKGTATGEDKQEGAQLLRFEGVLEEWSR
jgi:hypothetical protein